jgi:hypothetical protein
MMKKAAALLLPIFLGLTLSISALLLTQAVSVQANPSTLYVAPGGSCGGGVSDCYASLQAAVDAAAPGDEIRVAAGTYTDLHVRPRSDITTTGVVTQNVYLNKTLTIRGGYSGDFTAWDPQTYATLLDAQGQGRVLYVSGDINPTIQGLRITGGDATGMGGYPVAGDNDAGGGVYVYSASPILIGNQIYANTTPKIGGGLFLSSSSGALRENSIHNNQADVGSGIALYQGAPLVDSNQVFSNTSDNIGGGMYIYDAEAKVIGNTISGNSTINAGGGIDIASSSPTLIDNIIKNNTAQKGAGVYLWYSSSELTNDVIMDNQASAYGRGSGLWMGGSEPQILQTTFARNTGGDGSALMVTDAGSTPTSLVMTNTLIVDHSVGISVTAGSQVDLDGVLWHSTPVTISQSGATVNVQHQIQGDPALNADGYHLTAGSAAIDKGLPSGVHHDIDGQPRFSNTTDLGADEFWAPGSLHFIYAPFLQKGGATSP